MKFPTPGACLKKNLDNCSKNSSATSKVKEKNPNMFSLSLNA